MLHEMTPDFAGGVRPLNDLERYALAVGHQGNPNLLDFPKLLRVDLAAVNVFSSDPDFVLCSSRQDVLTFERGYLGQVDLRPGVPLLWLSRELLDIHLDPRKSPGRLPGSLRWR